MSVVYSPDCMGTEASPDSDAIVHCAGPLLNAQWMSCGFAAGVATCFDTECDDKHSMAVVGERCLVRQ